MVAEYNFRVVYVLVSDSQDLYYEQFFASVYSLKKYNPYLQVVLLTDDITNYGLKENRSSALQFVDEKVVVNFPREMQKKEKSRRLKTSFRKLINGKLLFVDTDTIVCDSLIKLNNINKDISMVLESNDYISKKYGFHTLKKEFDNMGCFLGINDEYFNSGVILVQDNSVTVEFFLEWNKLYLELFKTKGVSLDQPTLNTLNCKKNGLISRLPDIYNCQTDWGLKYFNSACILHYLGFNSISSEHQLFFSFSLFANKDIYLKVKETDSISLELERMIESPKEEIYKGVYIPVESSTFQIIHSNHMKILRVYKNKCKKIYDIFEKIYNTLFGLIAKRKYK